jgi:Leucine Rich repeat
VQVDDEVMQALAPHSGLKALNLSNTLLSSQGLMQLHRFPSLTHLRLEGCRHLSGELPDMAVLPRLQHLSFANCEKVSACAALTALHGCKHLTYLDLSWCHGSQQPLAHAATVCKTLESLEVLNLCRASLPSATLACVSELKSLRELNLSAAALAVALEEPRGANARDGLCASRGVLGGLPQLDTLTKLELRWCKVRSYIVCSDCSAFGVSRYPTVAKLAVRECEQPSTVVTFQRAAAQAFSA